MSLSLGELVGFVSLDDKDFDKGLDGAEGKFTKFGKKLGNTAMALGASAAVALGAGLVEAMSVEAANDKLAAELGLTEEESKRIGGVAGRLYADAYGESIEEVNTAVAAVISSIDGMRDASDEAVQSMTAKVMDLATAFGVDTAKAAQIAGQMIRTKLAKDGTEAMDLLVSAMQKVPAAVREDLLDTINEYSPFMQMVGIKGQQAMELLIGAAEKGEFGIDKTGDAIKEFTVLATDMSDRTKSAYKSMGMSSEKMTKDLLTGGDTARDAFNKIVTGLQNIKDPVAQSQAALALFGSPLEDLSTGEIPKFLASLTSAQGKLGDVSGAAQRMGDTLAGNAQAKVTSFQRTITTAFVDFVGGKVIPAIEGVVNWLRDKFGPALDTIGAIINDIALPALLALGVAATIAAGRMAAAWIAGLGPIGIIVTAVVALVALIISKWDTITQWLSDRWEWIKNTARTVWEHIKSAIVDPIIDAKNWIVDTFNNVVDFFKELPGKVGEGLGKIFDVLTKPFRDAYNAIMGIVNDIKDLWAEITGTVGGRITGGKTVGYVSPEVLAAAHGRATGGPVMAGHPYMVGERGRPELFVPGQSGTIIPDNVLASFYRDLDREISSVVAGATTQLQAPNLTSAMATAPPPFAGAGGQRAVVHIDDFHATPQQSPSDIAHDLDWLSRGGGY